MKKLLLATTAYVALTACGGVSKNAKIADLNDGQVEKVCKKFISSGPEPGEYDCGGGDTVTIEEPDVDECIDDLPAFGALCPSLTVGDILDCSDALGALDVCEDSEELPPECDAFFTCIFSSFDG